MILLLFCMIDIFSFLKSSEYFELLFSVDLDGRIPEVPWSGARGFGPWGARASRDITLQRGCASFVARGVQDEIGNPAKF